MRHFLNISIALLWLLCLVLTVGCRQPASANAPRVVEASNQTPSPTPVVQQTAPFFYETVESFGEADYGKLSGIVFYPPRKTLFAVRDNGGIVEIDTDGTLMQEAQIRKGADFEGITYDPNTDLLYVAVEGDEVILEVNPATLEIGRDIPIDRLFEGAVLFSPEGNGIEGITFVPAADGVPNGSFYLVNQSDELEGADPSIVFEVVIDDTEGQPYARIARYFSIGVTDLAGIEYDPASGGLLIISDSNNLLLEVSLTGQVVATYPLPGDKQEGITLDADGLIYIAQDQKEALQKFTPLGDDGQ
jgi:uncharacterized protein YjiK